MEDMESHSVYFGEDINWLITSRCNSNCKFCFSKSQDVEYENNVNKLSRRISESDIEMVTISGGEPLLVDGLVGIIKNLNESGKKVNLHTNGFYLNEEVAQELKPYINRIAIPVESIDERINDSIRRDGSLNAFKKSYDILNKYEIPTRIHTVFMGYNENELDGIYDYIRNGDFTSWKIFQENQRATEAEVDDEDFLLGEFLRAEDRLRKFKDDRIRFISCTDKMPYLFLKNNGAISYHPWFWSRDKVFGNLLDENFGYITNLVDEFIGSDSEDFFDAKWELPLWVRFIEGNYYTEEIEDLNSEDVKEFIELSELYKNH